MPIIPGSPNSNTIYNPDEESTASDSSESSGGSSSYDSDFHDQATASGSDLSDQDGDEDHRVYAMLGDDESSAKSDQSDSENELSYVYELSDQGGDNGDSEVAMSSDDDTSENSADSDYESDESYHADIDVISFLHPNLTEVDGKPRVTINGAEWKCFYEGLNYDIYFNIARDKVFKRPTDSRQSASESVCLWNEINPDYTAEVCSGTVSTDQGKDVVSGWMAPYINGEKLSEDEIVDVVIEIYKQTGHVHADPFSYDNFIKTNEGVVVCIDIIGVNSLKRILESQENEHHELYEYFIENETISPRLSKIIPALLLLQYYRPDTRNLDLLKSKENHLLASCIACYFNRMNDTPWHRFSKSLPFNMPFFLEIEFLKGIINHPRIEEDDRKQIMLLYLNHDFTDIKIKVFRHLILELEMDFDKTISLVFFTPKIFPWLAGALEDANLNSNTLKNIETLAKVNSLTKENIHYMKIKLFSLCIHHFNRIRNLTQERFAHIKKYYKKFVDLLNKLDMCRSGKLLFILMHEQFGLSLIHLNNLNKLNKTSYHIFLVLQKTNLLHYSNITQILNHDRLELLVNLIERNKFTFSREVITCQIHFDETIMHLDRYLPLDSISECEDHTKIFTDIMSSLERIKRCDSIDWKLDSFDRLFSAIRNSSLREERGFHRLFGKCGNTKRYQWAMAAVKAALLSQLEAVDPSSLSERAKEIASRISGIQSGRVSHPVGPRSARRVSAILS